MRLNGPGVAVERAEVQDVPVLRFALGSMRSAERTTILYERFRARLASRLGCRVEIVPRRTYAEANELLRTGVAQAGTVCAGAYAVGRAQFGLRQLVVPEIRKRATYRAYVVTRTGDPRRSFDELRGAVFAFSDPLSNAGYRWVVTRLHDRGTPPDRFFARTHFTYSHDKTIQAVRDGIADAGVVHDSVFEALARERPELRRELTVVDRSPDFPNPPVVISPRAPPELGARLRDVLLGLTSDGEGQAILHELGISRYVAVDESAYDDIARGWAALGVIDLGSPRSR